MYNLQHVRNYSYSQHPSEQKDEFILKMDPRTNQAVYLPISFKIALLKKKKMLYLSQEEELKLQKMQRAITPHFIHLVPRGIA